MSLGESGKGLDSGIRPGSLEIKDEVQGKYPFEEWEFSTPEAVPATVKVNRALIAPAVTTSTLTTGAIATDTLSLSTLALASLNVSTLVRGAVSATTLSTPAISSPNADIFACRAWVNFDGTTAANQAATYSRTGTTVTVALAAHGHLAGHVVYCNFISGGALDGIYAITGVPTADTFTLTTAASGTIAAGSTMNLLRRLIRGSGNIHDIVYMQPGIYRGNFARALPDATYCVTGTAIHVDSYPRRVGSYDVHSSGVVRSTVSFPIVVSLGTVDTLTDADTVDLSVFR
jgi:hypothetical protein